MTTHSKEIETITTPDTVLDEPRPVAPAAYTAPAATQPAGSKKSWMAALAGMLILGILGGFVVGLQVGKSSGTAGSFANASQTGGPGGMQGGMGRMGAFGTVTAISDSSITIQDERQGSTVTYAITSGTTVSDNGSTASVSDIQKGDTVMIQTAASTSSSSTDSTGQTASSIILNPSMQGGPGGTQNQNTQSNTSNSSSSSI